MKRLFESDLFAEILNKKRDCLFVSPHLDDAVFSAGGLISRLNDNGVNTFVINVFTKPSKNPYTFSIKRFLKKCGYTDADRFYRDRVLEDKVAVKKVGAKAKYLGFVDALWRRKNVNKIIHYFSKFIPELEYVYPLYRTSIAYGLISPHDSKLYGEIHKKVKKYLSKSKDPVLFLPLGIGLHTDHLIVRDSCSNFKCPTVYWADYPYIKNNDIDEKFISKLSLGVYNMRMTKNQKRRKEKAVNSYISQLNAIFDVSYEKVPDEEKYFI